MGQKITTTQFYLYGRKHFTRTGWQSAFQGYASEGLPDCDLSGKVFAVTGANSGIGKELSQFLSSKNGKVYMVCRNPDRGDAARKDILEINGEDSGPLEVLIGDVSIKADVVRLIEELSAKEDHLDALVCNAGALADELKLTPDGVEQTFGCHLLFGSYLLSKLAKPLLEKAAEPRVVFVSSGGMYNTKLPEWDVLTATKKDMKFNGQLAYAYCKRGQVLLAERLTAAAGDSRIQYVSCHPGWVDTPGVDAAYGSSKKYLEPLRTIWQGTEGIAWLCAAPSAKIQSGEFYLDRAPQTKHLAGYFMSEGTRTKNTDKEVDEMMANLESFAESLALPAAPL